MTTSRRDFLLTSATALGAITLISELPSSMIASPIDPMPEYKAVDFNIIKPSLLSMDGISAGTQKEHVKLYQGYVKKANEIVGKLSSLTDEDRKAANQTFSLVRELKVEYTFAVGGIKNHEVYFSNLGGKGGRPGGNLLSTIEKTFGSFDAWAADLKATAMAARGWAWLAWDDDRSSLFNFIGDAQNTFPVWGCTPILALDTYEHAYYGDFQTNRGAYIDAFMKNIDWNDVSSRFARAVK